MAGEILMTSGMVAGWLELGGQMAGGLLPVLPQGVHQEVQGGLLSWRLGGAVGVRCTSGRPRRR